MLSRRRAVAAAVGTLLLSGGAVAAPGFVDTGTGTGTTSEPTGGGEPAMAAGPEANVSRGDARPDLPAIDDAAAAAADQAEKAAEKAKKAEKKRAALQKARANPKGQAQSMLADYGWGSDQFGCLDALWSGESGWDYTATNPSSGAYGIPQSLPGSKMATAGKDWKTNPTTQITWGLGYIRAAYGTPCSAQSFKLGNGFY